MLYVGIGIAIFLLDYFIKSQVDKNCPIGVKKFLFKKKLYIEKYYNKGAMLNLLEKYPRLMKRLQTILAAGVAVWFYFTIRRDADSLQKVGLACLLGGGLNNLYDRYTKGHVVDYFGFGIGPRWLRRIIFNISDFFVFIGAAMTVIGHK